MKELMRLSASLALVLGTYQRYDEGIQNGIDRSGNHQYIVARNTMRADFLVPKAMDRLASLAVRRKCLIEAEEVLTTGTW